MSLIDVLGTGLAAGVVVQLIQVFRDWLAEKNARRLRAARQAFHLSNKLKIFSMACEDAISFHQIEETPPNQEGPDPPSLPDEDLLELTRELPDLDADILSRIADLEIQRRREESYINSGGYCTWA